MKQVILLLAFCTTALSLLSCSTNAMNNADQGRNQNRPDSAEIETNTVEYQHEDVTLEGYLARPKHVEEKRPGVLICHEWTGLSDYEKSRARQLAEEGYVVFSADIYGKDMRPDSHEEAAEISGTFRSNRDLFRERVSRGLSVLAEQPDTDPDHMAAMGYCFGGTAVLELARSGADISGVVSFHGGLSTPSPEDAASIQASVLVCHGAEDPHVPMSDVHKFVDRMKKHDVADWQVVTYGNTYHSFTNPDSGTDPSGGSAYNEQSAQRAWEDMLQFFDEIFQ